MSMSAPAPTPAKQTRFNARRDLIIKRAADVFGRHGFHVTTLDDIAGQLGVTKASLYYYFSTKEDLLYAVLKTAMQEHIDRVDRGLAAHVGASAAKKLEVAIIEHLRLLASEDEGAFLLQQEYELDDDDHRGEILALRDEYQRRFFDIIHEGGPEPLLPGARRAHRGPDDPRVDQLVSALVSVGRQIHRRRNRPRVRRHDPPRPTSGHSGAGRAGGRRTGLTPAPFGVASLTAPGAKTTVPCLPAGPVGRVISRCTTWYLPAQRDYR